MSLHIFFLKKYFIFDTFSIKKINYKYRHFFLLLTLLTSFSEAAQICGDPDSSPIKNANDCYVTGKKDAGNYLKSIDYANKALSLSPNNFRANALIAFSYMRMEQHARALPYFKNAIEQGAHSYDLYALYGMSLEALGDIDGAIKWYKQSLAIVPSLYDVTIKLANLLVRNNQKSEAIALLENFDAIQLKNGKTAKFQGRIMTIKEGMSIPSKPSRSGVQQTPLNRLEVIKNLFEKDLITKEEYEDKRNQIIKEM